jgi:O-antigen ligase
MVSENAFERGFYGAFARNTGVLTYTSLGILFVAVSTFESVSSYIKVIKAFIFAAIANIGYSVLAGAGFDIFTWNNPFNGAVLGTFGNPNFIGAFMGIFISTLFVLLIIQFRNKTYLMLALVGIISSLIVIKLSDALQGAVIPIFGFAIVSLIYSRSNQNLARFTPLISMIYSIGFILGGLGILNKGPLASLLYKPSLTFRGEYWQAGINMGLDRPLLGVGIDSYGSYFRTFRNESATVLPGVDTTTDAAHNVFVDIFAGGGASLLLIYLLLQIYIAKVAIGYLRIQKSFDPYFVFFFVAWCTYTIQSIFSINQIGLAVWGWIFGGAIVGYCRLEPRDVVSLTKSPVKSNKKSSSSDPLIPASAAMSAFVGFVIGIIIALPPFIKDVEFRNIQTKSGDSQQLIDLVQSWPLDSSLLNRGSVLLSNSGLNVLSGQVALFSTKAFPNDYAAWYSLYELSGVGSTEREQYRKVLKRIDPFNPKYFDK